MADRPRDRRLAPVTGRVVIRLDLHAPGLLAGGGLSSVLRWLRGREGVEQVELEARAGRGLAVRMVAGASDLADGEEVAEALTEALERLPAVLSVCCTSVAPLRRAA